MGVESGSSSRPIGLASGLGLQTAGIHQQEYRPESRVLQAEACSPKSEAALSRLKRQIWIVFLLVLPALCASLMAQNTPHFSVRDAIQAEWQRQAPVFSEEEKARLPKADHERLELSLKRIGAQGSPSLLPPELDKPTLETWEAKAKEARTPQERFTALTFLNRLKSPKALMALEGLKAEDAKLWPKLLHLEASIATARLNGAEISKDLEGFLNGLQKVGKIDPVRAQAARLRLVLAGKEKQLLSPVKATSGSILAAMDAFNRSSVEAKRTLYDDLVRQILKPVELGGVVIYTKAYKLDALGLAWPEHPPSYSTIRPSPEWERRYRNAPTLQHLQILEGQLEYRLLEGVIPNSPAAQALVFWPVSYPEGHQNTMCSTRYSALAKLDLKPGPASQEPCTLESQKNPLEQWLTCNPKTFGEARALSERIQRPGFSTRTLSQEVPAIRVLEEREPRLLLYEAWLLRALRRLDPSYADRLRPYLLKASDPLVLAAAIDDFCEAPADLDALIERVWKVEQYDGVQILLASLEKWKLPEERRKAILKRFYDHPCWTARWDAFRELSKLDPKAPWPSAPKSTETDEAILKLATELAEKGKPVRMRITFSGHRQITLKLNPVNAPMNVANLVILARQGFFDGHQVPRVVPDFVVQMGSPYDTMDGGPGYTVRCENSLDWYSPGSVGMALSGKDTGGSQFFITTNATPHLTGRYTRVGEVEDLDKALPILDDLEVGAKIEKVEVLR